MRGTFSKPNREFFVGHRAVAGLSGLAAASELSKAGLKTVVLEASAAVGGRTKLKRLGGVASVDCGAMWIHGWRGNPLSGLARAAGGALGMVVG